MNVWRYFITYLYLLFVIGGVGFVCLRLSVPTETSRKLIHILLVFTWVFLYKFFWYDWQIIIIPISFIVINALSYKFKWFKMIERQDEKENHLGTVYFAIAITILMSLALLFPETIMQTGIATFCLCFGDGFAALFGSAAKKRITIRKNKSLQGSTACFIGTVVGLLIFCLIMNYSIPWYMYILIGASTTLLELVGKGLDNFSITFGIYLLTSLMLRQA